MLTTISYERRMADPSAKTYSLARQDSRVITGAEAIGAVGLLFNKMLGTTLIHRRLEYLMKSFSNVSRDWRSNEIRFLPKPIFD
jgi:hypothetical protein